MASKEADKQKQTSKCVQPVKPSYMVDLTKSMSLKWATKLGFQTLVAQDWDTLVVREGAETLLNTFVERDTLVPLGKKRVIVTTWVIKEALGLLDERITEADKNYAMA